MIVSSISGLNSTRVIWQRTERDLPTEIDQWKGWDSIPWDSEIDYVLEDWTVNYQ